MRLLILVLAVTAFDAVALDITLSEADFQRAANATQEEYWVTDEGILVHIVPNGKFRFRCRKDKNTPPEVLLRESRHWLNTLQFKVRGYLDAIETARKTKQKVDTGSFLCGVSSCTVTCPET